MIRFTCPKCGKHLKAPADYAGKRVVCTRCGVSLLAPAVEAAPGPTWLEPPETAALAVPKRRSRAGLALALGAATLLLAGAIFAVWLWTRNPIEQALQDLKSSDPTISKPALETLVETDPVDAERAKVTAAMEGLLADADARRHLDADKVLRVYLAWADSSNVPTMMRMVQSPTIPGWTPQQTGLVMSALAKFGDERAFGVLAEKLADPALHDQAMNALRTIGSKAQPAVLDYAFDDDPGTQQRAFKLLAEWGATPQTIADEAFARLKSPQPEIRRSAVVWFIENAPDSDSQKAQGAKLLGKLLLDQPPKVCGKVLHALKLWATRDCLADLAEYARRDQKNPAGNSPLIELLARFPDPAAADAIAMQLPNPNTRAKAGQALLKLGNVSQSAVLQYLNFPDPAVQLETSSLARLLKISDQQQLDQTVADTASAQIPRSLTALHHLAQIRPDDANRTKVSKALNATLVDPTRGLSDESLEALRVWGTAENTDTLVKMLEPFGKSGMGRNVRVIEFLGALKDPRAAAALAPGLEHGRERPLISTALKKIGAASQDAVIPYLDSVSEATRIEACRILGDVGTSKCLDALHKAYDGAGGDLIFSQELMAAMQKIAARK